MRVGLCFEVEEMNDVWWIVGMNPSFGLRDFVTFLDYGWTHSIGNFRLIAELDLINKTSEFARIYGIEFYHVSQRSFSKNRGMKCIFF